MDEETGLSYYGARYYNPRVSNWLSVDPIALYDPVMEIEHYIDGEHNGGYFNPRNTSIYGYTYQNPVLYTDPNGKQSVAEWIAGIKNPWIASDAKFKKGGNNIGTTATRFAYQGSSPEAKFGMFTSENQSKKKGKGTGSANAIRHIGLSAMLHNKYSGDPKGVNEVLDAHEGNVDLDLTKRQADDYNSADMLVDALNNDLGEKIGKSLDPKSSRKDVFKAIIKEGAENGVYQAFYNEKSKKYDIKREKLSAKQVRAAHDVISKKDENAKWIK